MLDVSYECPAGDYIEVSWWYHIHGATMGTLRLTMPATSTILWSKSGNQGEDWQSASAYVPAPALSFEAVVQNWDSDSAVDDITITCSLYSPSPPNSPPRLPPSVPSPPSPPSPPSLPSFAFSFDSDDRSWTTGETLEDGTPLGNPPYGFCRRSGAPPGRPWTGPAAAVKGEGATSMSMSTSMPMCISVHAASGALMHIRHCHRVVLLC